MSKTAGIRELKEQLSAYLRRVQAGETIIVTDRGKPVGRIVPYEQPLSTRLGWLQQAGFLAWNGETLPPAGTLVQNQGSQTVAELLLEDRA